MIIGIGTDILEIARVKRILAGDRSGRFLRRILTEGELAQAAGKQARLAEFVASRFAAKEAVVKALGCGIGERTGFRDMDIVPEPSGKPVCRLTDRAREAVGFRVGDRLHVTLSHSDGHAVAFAVWERPD